MKHTAHTRFSCIPQKSIKNYFTRKRLPLLSTFAVVLLLDVDFKTVRAHDAQVCIDSFPVPLSLRKLMMVVRNAGKDESVVAVRLERVGGHGVW